MKNQASARRHTQSGSIFFWIFFMVIMFAALSFALTTGFRSGAATVSGDKARLAATEIMDYGRIVRDGVKAMRINGVAFKDLDFRSNTLTYQNGNPYNIGNNNCLVDACQVFSKNGGNVADLQFYEYGFEPSWWGQTWSHVGGVEPALVKIEGLGTSLPELAFRVASVQVEVCKAMNKLNGIDRFPIEEDYSGETYYAYNWDVDAMLAETDQYHFGQDVAEFRNKIAFCTGNSDGGDIYVLIEAR